MFSFPNSPSLQGLPGWRTSLVTHLLQFVPSVMAIYRHSGRWVARTGSCNEAPLTLMVRRELLS